MELLYECSSKIKDLDKSGKLYYLNKLNEIAHEYKEKLDKLMDNKDSNKYNLSMDNESVLRNVTINKIISIEYEIDMMIRNQKEKQEFNEEMSSLYNHFNSIANEEVFNSSDKVYQMSYKKLN